MGPAENGKWSAEQQDRLAEFDIRRSVDIHCHCLPGIDDGPGSMDEALALCSALVKDGITSVVATPHQLGRYDRLNTAGQIREAITQLVSELTDHDIPLEIFPGGDVRVDERLPRLLESGEVGTVADAGMHILLELPHELFVDPLPVIDFLRSRGLQAIMTHPERHHYLVDAGRWARHWIEHGAVLQITAGSLLHEFGARAYESAWGLVSSGMASLVASDAHDVRRRPPRMSEAIEILTRQLGRKTARLLTIDNPLRVLNGQAIEAPQLA
jgi:protein-tyrosine phosphatase